MGKMPAALKAYWAKKRAGTAKPRKVRKLRRLKIRTVRRKNTMSKKGKKGGRKHAGIVGMGGKILHAVGGGLGIKAGVSVLRAADIKYLMDSNASIAEKLEIAAKNLGNNSSWYTTDIAVALLASAVSDEVYRGKSKPIIVRLITG